MKTFFLSSFFFFFSFYTFGQTASLQEGDWSEPSACSNCLECNGEKVDGLESLKKIAYTCESGEVSRWYVIKKETKSCNAMYFTISSLTSNDTRFNTLEEVMQHVQQDIEERCKAKKEVSFVSDDTVYEAEDNIELPTFEVCLDVSNEQDKKECERRHINRNALVKYPAAAREIGTEGTVIVRLTIEKDGRVSNSEIMKDIGSGCGQAALDAINEAIRQNELQWIPANKNGQVVRSKIKIPMKFKLAN